MSYDLMVFRKEAAPKDRDAFLHWYDKQIDLVDNHCESEQGAVELVQWYQEISVLFPPINCPCANAYTSLYCAKYSIGKDVIHVVFSWKVADQAHSKVIELAKKYGLGFFDVSSPQTDIWFPRNGTLVALKNPEKGSTLVEICKDFAEWWLKVFSK